MLTDKTGAAVSVLHQPSERRYAIEVETTAPPSPVTVGFTAYRDRDIDGSPARVFFHTEVADDFAGRGLATILIREALDATRAEGRTIVGVCPLVAAYLRKNPEYSDVTHAVTPDILSWLNAELG